MLKLVKKIDFVLVFWFFAYFLLFGLLLRNSFDYLDTDLGWHLKVGEEISLTKSVPHVNHFNFTYTGNWVDHEWFANLIAYKIYSNFGYIALTIFFALVILAALIISRKLAKKFFPRAPEALLFVLQLFGVIACLPHFGIRIQEFGFLFLVIELWIIAEYDRSPSLSTILWLWPLSYLWANMHGSFLLGLGLMYAWLGIRLFEFFIARTAWGKYIFKSDSANPKSIKKFALVSAGALALTFLTPYGTELYSFLGGYGNDFYLKVIEEWLPQFNYPYNYWQLAYLALTLSAAFLFLREAVMNRFVRTDIWRLFLLVFFVYLSFSSRRHFPLMFAATYLFIVEELCIRLEFKGRKIADTPLLMKLFIIACLFWAALYQYQRTAVVNSPFFSYCGEYPCQALSFLRSNQELKDLPIFNEYNWGGYLIFTYPEKKLFIDGRLPQTVFAGHTFVEEYLEFFKKETNYSQKLAEYNIGLILIKTADNKLAVKKWEKVLFWINDKSLKPANYLRSFLAASPQWKLIYQDNLASIYKKVD